MKGTTMKHEMVGIKDGSKFSIEQVGIERERQDLIDMIANAPKASIIHVHAYESKNGHGEVANFFYLKGVDYGRMKDRSYALLGEIADNPDFSISVTRGVWQDSAGTNHNRKAKGRTFKTVTQTYKHGDEMLQQAISKVMESILNPKARTNVYEKQGNGIYEQDEGTLHIRDCRLLHKVVIKEGDYPQKATGELVALTNALKKLLPISKYRQVRLDGRYDYITVGGQIIMQDEAGEKVFVGFAEHKGLIQPRIVGLENEVPMRKIPVETLKPSPEQEKEQEMAKEFLDLLG